MKFSGNAQNSPTVSLTKSNRVRMINQLLLPEKEVYEEYSSYKEIVGAIKNMVVRGAPAIGITAGYGYFLGALQIALETCDLELFKSKMDRVKIELLSTRPTAVNLFWAIEKMEAVLNGCSSIDESLKRLREESIKIHNDDIERCFSIGKHGKTLLRDGIKILTHCNAGALATGNYGTALGVIRAGFEAYKNIMVYADETRPYLQGARLTAWELNQDSIPVTVICDNTAGYMMKNNKIDIIVTGADRIARNGDTANKIGTYSLAVLAEKHNIPFYIAAPLSTVDWNIFTGDEIIIEERAEREVKWIRDVMICPENVPAVHIGFDVTPFSLIKGIITEKGIIYPPYIDNLKKLKGE